LKIEMFYFGIHAESPITPILDHIWKMLMSIQIFVKLW
jgi:hypothetical protein